MQGLDKHARSLMRYLLNLHSFFSLFTGIKCPVCAKFIPPEEIECHLVICLTKPRISYNGNFLIFWIFFFWWIFLIKSKYPCLYCYLTWGKNQNKNNICLVIQFYIDSTRSWVRERRFYLLYIHILLNRT